MADYNYGLRELSPNTGSRQNPLICTGRWDWGRGETAELMRFEPGREEVVTAPGCESDSDSLDHPNTPAVDGMTMSVTIRSEGIWSPAEVRLFYIQDSSTCHLSLDNKERCRQREALSSYCRVVVVVVRHAGLAEARDRETRHTVARQKNRHYLRDNTGSQQECCRDQAGVKSSGGISVKSSGGMSVKSSGGMSVKSSGGMSVKSSGGMSVKSSGGMSVKSSGDKAVSVEWSRIKWPVPPPRHYRQGCLVT
ncbi:hypothetical protein RRG08_038562 [Elysia crispata]|uniref:Uncharacterized protein n=1 Tax=Elysia crispata TaxID=231223 RepID=A0AAE0YG85_9GAST|nr:hypothetical protein RRG08_038562 [Elysia crispata]